MMLGLTTFIPYLGILLGVGVIVPALLVFVFGRLALKEGDVNAKTPMIVATVALALALLGGFTQVANIALALSGNAPSFVPHLMGGGGPKPYHEDQSSTTIRPGSYYEQRDKPIQH